jgi:hypothetical protein
MGARRGDGGQDGAGLLILKDLKIVRNRGQEKVWIKPLLKKTKNVKI